MTQVTTKKYVIQIPRNVLIDAALPDYSGREGYWLHLDHFPNGCYDESCPFAHIDSDTWVTDRIAKVYA